MEGARCLYSCLNWTSASVFFLFVSKRRVVAQPNKVVSACQRQPARTVTGGQVTDILSTAFWRRAANNRQAELLAAAAGRGRGMGGRGCWL
jgi:hypothetical protein